MPPAYVPTPDAILLAQRAGISARLLVGIEVDPAELLVALRSTDPDSTLHLIYRPPFGPNEVPLERRSQSGPERWDYPVELPVWRDRYVLRLGRGGRIRDLPLLSAAQAIIHAHGWTDDTTLLGEPVVSVPDLERAIAELSAEPSRG